MPYWGIAFTKKTKRMIFQVILFRHSIMLHFQSMRTFDSKVNHGTKIIKRFTA